MRTPQLEKISLSHGFLYMNRYTDDQRVPYSGQYCGQSKITLAVLDRVQNRYCGQSRGNGCMTVLELKTSFLEDLAQKFVFI